MKNQGDPVNGSGIRSILPPAYPFSGPELLGDLRSRLAREEGHSLGFMELAELMGQPKSTAHFWFSLYKQPQLLAFMSLLERLLPLERQSFIDAHCRVLPLLTHSTLKGQKARLAALLAQPTGLTIVTGHSDLSRTFVLTGLGHSWSRLNGKHNGPCGIDIHRPETFVPIHTLRYFDENLNGSRIRESVLSVWPKILTSKSQLLLGNRLWSLVPEARNDLLRLAARKHVVLAEQTSGEFAALGRKLPVPTNIITLSAARKGAGICITCRRVNPSKSQ